MQKGKRIGCGKVSRLGWGMDDETVLYSELEILAGIPLVAEIKTTIH